MAQARLEPRSPPSSPLDQKEDLNIHRSVEVEQPECLGDSLKPNALHNEPYSVLPYDRVGQTARNGK